MPDSTNASHERSAPLPSQPSAPDRRGFLLGAAALAATPLATHGSGKLAAAAGRPIDNPATDAVTLSGRRRLGSLEVSGIGLGCQTMPGNLYGPVSSRANMISLIRTAVDQGVTLFDTAEAYGPFESERIVGEALRPVRDHVVIASKFGWNIDLETGERGPGFNSRPEHIGPAVEGMLKRLRTDHIDLLYQHRVDPAVPIEDVAGAVGELISAGKVRHWGLSEPGLGTVRRAHATQPLTVIQNEYNLMWRGAEAEVLPLCEELGLGFVCWAPLAYGFTTGTINPATRFAEGDFRAMVPRNSRANMTANMDLVQLLLDWGVRKGATPGQLSLAWLQAQRPWVVPIPSATRTAHLLENLGAEEFIWEGDELSEFNTALDGITIEGARLPAPILAQTGVEAPPRPPS